MQKTKLGKKFYLALVIFSLVGQVAWVVENMYLNVFIYEMFNATAEQISLMVAASAVAATVTTLLIGALSDKVGKRKIFICGGYTHSGIATIGVSLVCAGLAILLYYICLATSKWVVKWTGKMVRSLKKWKIDKEEA